MRRGFVKDYSAVTYPVTCEYDVLNVFLSFFPSSPTECVVACHKFVEVNALGLTVAALSSYDANMRAAAYFVLSSFRSHLEGARFREQRQVSLNSVDCLSVGHFMSWPLTGEVLPYSSVYLHMIKEPKEAFYPLSTSPLFVLFCVCSFCNHWVGKKKKKGKCSRNSYVFYL